MYVCKTLKVKRFISIPNFVILIYAFFISDFDVLEPYLYFKCLWLFQDTQILNLYDYTATLIQEELRILHKLGYSATSEKKACVVLGKKWCSLIVLDSPQIDIACVLCNLLRISKLSQLHTMQFCIFYKSIFHNINFEFSISSNNPPPPSNSPLGTHPNHQWLLARPITPEIKTKNPTDVIHQTIDSDILVHLDGHHHVALVPKWCHLFAIHPNESLAWLGYPASPKRSAAVSPVFRDFCSRSQYSNVHLESN